MVRSWLSAIVERNCALRRRRGSTSFCLPRGGLVGTAGSTKERRGRREEANVFCALGVGAKMEEPAVDPGITFFCLATRPSKRGDDFPPFRCSSTPSCSAFLTCVPVPDPSLYVACSLAGPA